MLSLQCSIATALIFALPLSASALTPPVSGSISEFWTFSDVPSSAWCHTHVVAAAEMGIVSGYKDAQGKPTGKFGPADNVALAQALKMAVMASAYSPVAAPDVYPAGNHWAKPYLNVAI